jgi:hypothetical protein
MAAPWHAYALLAETAMSLSMPMVGVGVGLVLGLAVGVASVVLPLRAGIRALRAMEF